MHNWLQLASSTLHVLCPYPIFVGLIVSEDDDEMIPGCSYGRFNVCRLLELTVRSNISPQYFSESVSKSACIRNNDEDSRDAGGSGGIGRPFISHSELILFAMRGNIKILIKYSRVHYMLDGVFII